MIHNTNTGCIFFRYMWGSNNGLGGRCQGITQQLSTDDHNFQPTDASKFLPKLAPTDVNENRTQITSNFCRFHSIFYRFSSTDAHAQKEEDNEQFLPPGGRAISDNPKIIASFTLHISINFFHKQVLILRPHWQLYLIISKSLFGCDFSSLHCTGLDCREVFILCLEEKVRISATSSSPPLQRDTRCLHCMGKTSP